MDNQVRSRIDPSLIEPLTEMAMAEGMDVSEYLNVMIRQQIIGKCPLPTARISKESKDVRKIVDEKIEALHQAGLFKRGKDAEVWISEAIEDARARVIEKKKSTGERYFIVINGRALGPHRVDKLREWVLLDMLSPDTVARGTRGGKSITLNAIPKFNETPAVLRKKLLEKENEPRKEWMDRPATAKQIHRLDFFNIPYDKQGLKQGRASDLITQFAFIDPEKEKQYNLTEKGK